jgi:hypothetical protein
MFHFGTSSWGGARKSPKVFTQEGVAMLSSVLRSKRAVQVNIRIMRAFVKFREFLQTHSELAKKFKELESKVGKHDDEIKSIIEAINILLDSPRGKIKKIGFKV